MSRNENWWHLIITLVNRYKYAVNRQEIISRFENQRGWRMLSVITASSSTRLHRWSVRGAQFEAIISDSMVKSRYSAWINAIWMTLTTVGIDVMACIRAPRSVCGSTDDIKADSTRNVIQVPGLCYRARMPMSTRVNCEFVKRPRFHCVRPRNVRCDHRTIRCTIRLLYRLIYIIFLISFFSVAYMFLDSWWNIGRETRSKIFSSNNHVNSMRIYICYTL